MYTDIWDVQYFFVEKTISFYAMWLPEYATFYLMYHHIWHIRRFPAIRCDDFHDHFIGQAYDRAGGGFDRFRFYADLIRTVRTFHVNGIVLDDANIRIIDLDFRIFIQRIFAVHGTIDSDTHCALAVRGLRTQEKP